VTKEKIWTSLRRLFKEKKERKRIVPQIAQIHQVQQLLKDYNDTFFNTWGIGFCFNLI
jgi:hypothetical protein